MRPGSVSQFTLNPEIEDAMTGGIAFGIVVLLISVGVLILIHQARTKD